MAMVARAVTARMEEISEEVQAQMKMLRGLDEAMMEAQAFDLLAAGKGWNTLRKVQVDESEEPGRGETKLITVQPEMER